VGQGKIEDIVNRFINIFAQFINYQLLQELPNYMELSSIQEASLRERPLLVGNVSANFLRI
jgi:hypothetical protein